MPYQWHDLARIEVDKVSYWHVELDSHDILIANNLPAESYMAMSNRAFFEEAATELDTLSEATERPMRTSAARS